MIYIKVEQGEVVDGPLNRRMIRQRWPNTSFAANNVEPPEDGWVKVGRTIQEEVGEYEMSVSNGYAEIDGEWHTVFSKRPMTAEEISKKDGRKADQHRARRSRLLSESDYTQLADYPNPDKALWATYRQELRDLPSQADFPRTVTYPDKPGQLREEQ
jgi:hypothetical protein